MVNMFKFLPFSHSDYNNEIYLYMNPYRMEYMIKAYNNNNEYQHIIATPTHMKKVVPPD